MEILHYLFPSSSILFYTVAWLDFPLATFPWIILYFSDTAAWWAIRLITFPEFIFHLPVGSHPNNAGREFWGPRRTTSDFSIQTSSIRKHWCRVLRIFLVLLFLVFTLTICSFNFSQNICKRVPLTISNYVYTCMIRKKAFCGRLSSTKNADAHAARNKCLSTCSVTCTSTGVNTSNFL